MMNNHNVCKPLKAKSTMNSVIRYYLFLLVAGLLISNVSYAADQILAVGIDRKFDYNEDTGKYLALEPGHDEILFYSLERPEDPRFIGGLSIGNSVVGPPTNIAITPNQKTAIIASAITSVQNKEKSDWKMAPSDYVTIVDLTPPIRIADMIKVGKQPSGIAIDSSGKMALVANRGDKSISVLSIDGDVVKVTDTIDMGDVVTSVAISPDGHKAFATKFAQHKVAELVIDPSGKVTYSGRDIPVGLYPWTVNIAADGSRAIVTNIGAKAAADGNAKTVSIIDLSVQPARVAQHVTVGDAPEGVVISPDSKLAAISVLAGSYAVPKDAWWRREVGQLSILQLGDEGVSLVETIDVGSFPEGLAFSADSSHIYVGNFASKTLSVVTLKKDGTVQSIKELILPGPPGSLRVSGQ